MRHKTISKHLWQIATLVLFVMLVLYSQGIGREALTGITSPSKRVLYVNEPVEYDLYIQHDNTTILDSNSTIISYVEGSDDYVTIADISVTLNGEPVDAVVTELVPSHKYHVKINNPTEGYLTTVVKTKLLTIELKAPVVNLEYNFPLQVFVGETKTLFAKTLTPQGAILNADKVTVEVVDPNNKVDIFEMTKASDGMFEHEMVFRAEGNYYFTITPSAASLNYKSTPRDATTVVMGQAPVPVFYYFMIANAVVFVLILVVKNRKKIGGMF